MYSFNSMISKLRQNNIYVSLSGLIVTYLIFTIIPLNRFLLKQIMLENVAGYYLYYFLFIVLLLVFLIVYWNRGSLRKSKVIIGGVVWGYVASIISIIAVDTILNNDYQWLRNLSISDLGLGLVGSLATFGWLFGGLSAVCMIIIKNK
jgi:hypothetical protein